MKQGNGRYVAEIELSDGYISIDFEIKYGTENHIRFFLNQCSVDESTLILEDSTAFKRKLFEGESSVIITGSRDIENLITGILRKEFGDNVDIVITKVDFD